MAVGKIHKNGKDVNKFKNRLRIQALNIYLTFNSAASTLHKFKFKNPGAFRAYDASK